MDSGRPAPPPPPLTPSPPAAPPPLPPPPVPHPYGCKALLLYCPLHVDRVNFYCVMVHRVMRSVKRYVTIPLPASLCILLKAFCTAVRSFLYQRNDLSYSNSISETIVSSRSLAVLTRSHIYVRVSCSVEWNGKITGAA